MWFLQKMYKIHTVVIYCVNKILDHKIPKTLNENQFFYRQPSAYYEQIDLINQMIVSICTKCGKCTREKEQFYQLAKTVVVRHVGVR
jgi:hypothetical protein